MVTRRDAIKTAVIGAGIGVGVFALILALAKYWYATSFSPLILVLSPGVFVGLFNPQNSDIYFAMAFVVQAASYALVALALRFALHHIAHRGKDAV